MGEQALRVVVSGGDTLLAHSHSPSSPSLVVFFFLKHEKHLVFSVFCFVFIIYYYFLFFASWQTEECRRVK